MREERERDEGVSVEFAVSSYVLAAWLNMS